MSYASVGFRPETGEQISRVRRVSALTVCETEKEQSRGKAHHPGLDSQHVAGASLSLWMASYKHPCPFK